MIFDLRRLERLDRLAPWLLGGLVLAVATWAAEPYPVGIFHDDGVYATLARALAGGDGFRYLNLPGAPVATHYPPAYPLMLAALWKLGPNFPQNIPLLQMANAVALSLAAVGTAWFARRTLGWSQPAAMAVAIVGCLSYPLIVLSAHLLSEPLFAAALFPALMLAERAANSDRSREAVIAGLVAGALTLVRTHGVALVAAIVLVLLMRRQLRHAAAAAAAAAVVIAPWQVFALMNNDAILGSLRGKYAGYGPWLIEGWRGGAGFVGATVASNLRELNALLADRFSLSDHALPRLLTGVCAALLAGAGALRLARIAPVTAVFMAAYLGILLLWPYTPWRFFYAVWPVVILSVGETIRWLVSERPRERVMAGLGLTLTAALMLGMVRAEHRAYRDRAWYQSTRGMTRAIAPVVRWVSANTRPADVVAVEPEQIVYLFTGRQAVPPAAFTAAEYVRPTPMSVTAASLRQLVADYPVNYVVTRAPDVYRSARLLAAGPDSSSVHLVPLETFSRSSGGGGAFRVERRNHSTSQP